MDNLTREQKESLDNCCTALQKASMGQRLGEHESRIKSLEDGRTGVDVKVKVSADDEAAQFLEDKLVEGDNITIEKETSEAGVETLKISAAGGGSGPVPTAGLLYTLIDGDTHWNVALGTAADTEIIIPETYDDGVTGSLPVTEIAEAGFYEATAITKVTLPTSITKINNDAFFNCVALVTINLPEGLISIGDNGFRNDAVLANIVFPKTLTTLGAYSFRQCYAIKEIIIPEGVTVIPDFCFQQTHASKLVLPESLTTIGAHVFELPPNMTEITIPKNVTTIGDGAFSGGYLTVDLKIKFDGMSPPTLGTDVFLNRSNLIIQLRDFASLAAYAADASWASYLANLKVYLGLDGSVADVIGDMYIRDASLNLVRLPAPTVASTLKHTGVVGSVPYWDAD